MGDWGYDPTPFTPDEDYPMHPDDERELARLLEVWIRACSDGDEGRRAHELAVPIGTVLDCIREAESVR